MTEEQVSLVVAPRKEKNAVPYMADIRLLDPYEGSGRGALELALSSPGLTAASILTPVHSYLDFFFIKLFYFFFITFFLIMKSAFLRPHPISPNPPHHLWQPTVCSL